MTGHSPLLARPSTSACEMLRVGIHQNFGHRTGCVASAQPATTAMKPRRMRTRRTQRIRSMRLCREVPKKAHRRGTSTMQSFRRPFGGAPRTYAPTRRSASACETPPRSETYWRLCREVPIKALGQLLVALLTPLLRSRCRGAETVSLPRLRRPTRTWSASLAASPAGEHQMSRLPSPPRRGTRTQLRSCCLHAGRHRRRRVRLSGSSGARQAAAALLLQSSGSCRQSQTLLRVPPWLRLSEPWPRPSRLASVLLISARRSPPRPDASASA
mmetsp:Transcript_30856/g.67513  ORF Transcript_30856/g.67513 Transcript_30856/m.67513 type:complete len:271 (+) Transcript_30856:839-1651(+)